MKRLTLLLLCLFCTVAALAQKDSVVRIPIEVSAQANIYYSEITDTSTVRGGAGIAAIEIDVRGVRMVTFEKAEGKVTAFGEYDSTYFGADGGKYGAKTAVSSYGSFAGISHGTKVMFLAGVLVSEHSRLDLPPDDADYSINDSWVEYVPSFGQPFFIGDGKTKEGATQRWHISKDATVMYIGFADCLSGPPSNYSNNAGSIKVTVILHYADKGKS